MIFLCVFLCVLLLLLNDTGDLSSASEDDNSDEDSDSRDLAAYHCRHCFSTCKYFEEENKKKMHVLQLEKDVCSNGLFYLFDCLPPLWL